MLFLRWEKKFFGAALETITYLQMNAMYLYIAEGKISFVIFIKAKQNKQ